MSASLSPPPTLHTERLVIRPFSHDDAPFILELLNDEEFIKHIQDRGVRNLEHARDYLTNGPLESYARFGFGLCCVVEQNTLNSVGMCGLIQRETLPVPDIGYAFLPAARSKGYAYEASREMAAFARLTLGLDRILAVTSESNVASQKLLEKLGFKYLMLAQFEPDSESVPCFELEFARMSSDSQ